MQGHHASSFALLTLALTAACGDDRPPPAPDYVAETGGRLTAHTGGSGGASGGHGSGGVSAIGGSGGVVSGSGGASGTGGSGASNAGAGGASGMGGGTTGGSAGASAGAPKVTITNPVAVTDPSRGPVIVNGALGTTNDQIDVVCTAHASAGGSSVNSSTVTLEMFDTAGVSVKRQPASPTGNAGEYSATFDVASLPNGALSFDCSASDTSVPPGTGKASVATFVDHGPTIHEREPAPDSGHSLQVPLSVAFSVVPAPLAATDPQAGVAEVRLQINNVTIPLSLPPDAGTAGDYSVSVDLNDTSLFQTKPNGSVPVMITATDKRSPTAAVRTDTYHFFIDGTGPTITITKPRPGIIVGGKVPLEFTVTDPLPGSGVDPQTIVVTVAGVAHRYGTELTLWTKNVDTYTFTLDTTTIPVGSPQFTVDIGAQDVAGNAAANASALYYLDNEPPTVDLDPPDIIETRQVSGQTACSQPFDPLGAAVNDLAPIAGVTKFRALAWDNTNAAPGQSVFYFAGIDQSSVGVYAQADTSVPLLVDLNKSDADPTCNEINPDLVAQTGTLAFLQLDVMPPAGSSDFSVAAPPECPATSGSPPTPLCGGNSDLTRVIQHSQLPSSAPAEAVIYGLQTDACPGGEWDLVTAFSAGTLNNGWICVSARGLDRAGAAAGIPGNIGVSAPLRLCLNDPRLGTAPDCAVMSTMPPSCTDGCTPPAHFSMVRIPLP